MMHNLHTTETAKLDSYSVSFTGPTWKSFEAYMSVANLSLLALKMTNKLLNFWQENKLVESNSKIFKLSHIYLVLQERNFAGPMTRQLHMVFAKIIRTTHAACPYRSNT